CQTGAVACQAPALPSFSKERKTSERYQAQGSSCDRANRFETRSLSALARCYPRSFAFYVAHPIRSIHPSASFLVILCDQLLEVVKLGELAAIVGRDELLELIRATGAHPSGLSFG